MESPAEYLIGVRLHESAQADDYRLVDLDAHVGDLVMVETAANGTAIGEVPRPRRELPESQRDRLYRRGGGPARAPPGAGEPRPPVLRARAHVARHPPARGSAR